MSDEAPVYSVVLPAYLEEENLRLLLPRIRAEFALLPGSAEIVVVDTVEPLDATSQACAEHGARYVNRGPSNDFGDAVRTGIREARGQWMIFMDADGSHTPEFIHRLVEETPANDLVIASRYIDGGYTENSLLLVVMSRVLNFSYALILGLRMKDVSNSFKIYRAEHLRALTLRCRNFDIVEEILFKITRAHPQLRFKELPFSFKKRMFGETKRNLALFIVTYLYTIVKLRLLS